MDPDVGQIIGTLNIAANVVVLVILPLVIFLVKHVSGVEKKAHERINGVEREHQDFKVYAAREFMREESAVRMIDGNRELLESQLRDIIKSQDRIEKWVSRLSDRDADRGKPDQDHR